MSDEEEYKKLLYERKRTRPLKVAPHELKPMNRLVAGGIIAGTIAAIIAGWYVMQVARPAAGKAVVEQEAKDGKKAE